MIALHVGIDIILVENQWKIIGCGLSGSIGNSNSAFKCFCKRGLSGSVVAKEIIDVCRCNGDSSAFITGIIKNDRLNLTCEFICHAFPLLLVWAWEMTESGFIERLE